MIQRDARTCLPILLGLLLAGTVQAQGWKQVYPPYEAETYTSILEAGPDTLFITGLNFTLLRSTDQGEHWEQMFRSLDGYDIWRAGYDGNMLYFLPGGQRYGEELGGGTQPFLFRYDPSTGDTVRIAFPAFARPPSLHLELSVCRGALFVLESHYQSNILTIARSTDGGATWDSITLPDSLKRWQYSPISFRDANHGFYWGVEPSGGTNLFTLYSTRDGGVTWKRHPEIQQAYARVPIELPLCWVNDTTVAVVDLVGTTHLSTDAGETWVRKANTYGSEGVSITMKADGSGFCIGKRFDIFRTSDFGATWVKVRDAFTYWTESKGVMTGSSTFTVISAKGYRIRTTDGGLSWTDDQIDELLSIGRLRFFDTRTGFISSMYNNGGGLVVRYYRSGDGGASWTPLEPSSERYMDVVPVSPDVLYAFANDTAVTATLVMKSTDAGGSWTPCLRRADMPRFQYTGDFGAFNGRLHRGIDTVFVFSDSAIVRTDDGGRHWRRFPSLPPTFDQYVDYLMLLDLRRADVSWALSSKKCMRSTDDGVSWDTVLTVSQTHATLEHMEILGDSRVVVFARDTAYQQVMYQSFDRGITWSCEVIVSLYTLRSGPANALFPDGSGSQPIARSTTVPGGAILEVHATADSWKTSQITWSISMGSNAYNTGGQVFSLDPRTTWLWFGDRIYFTSNGGVNAAEQPPVPSGISLAQNYPNPFSIWTTIPYTVDAASGARVRIELMDAVGRHVRTLVDTHVAHGTYSCSLNAGDLRPGMYFIRLVSAARVEMRKMMVVR